MKEGFNRNNTIDIEAFRLELATKEVIDLMNMFLELNIHVSMEAQGMSATLFMNDPLNIANNGPILGGERVFIRFRSPLYAEFTEVNLRVSMQVERLEESSSNASVRLELISESFYNALRQKVSMGFNGQYSSAAKSYFERLKLLKPIELDDSVGLNKFCVPMTNNAIENLDWMADRARTGDGLGFGFFEDLATFSFASYSKMLSQEPSFSLIFQTQMTEETVEKEFRNVLGLQHNMNAKDAINFMTSGLSGRTEQVYDPIRKAFQYVKNSPQAAFDGRPSLGNGRVGAHDTSSDFIEFALKKPDDSELDTFKRQSLRYCMGDSVMTVVTAGDNRMRLGTVLDFEIPSSQLQNQNELINEKFYGGKFIVTSLKHCIRPSEYRLYWDLTKESLTEKAV